jgi:hypothetical protein
MKFLEKDLEEIIFDSDHNDLYERGLDFCTKPFIKKRQLRIGNYGVADLVFLNRPYYFEDNRFGQHENYKEISVLELKKDTININSLLQAVRYAKGIQRYLNRYKDDHNDYYLNIVLIGKNVNKGDFIYLTDLVSSINSTSSNGAFGMTSIYFYTYNYEIDGLNFKCHSGYKLTNEGF